MATNPTLPVPVPEGLTDAEELSKLSPDEKPPIAEQEAPQEVEQVSEQAIEPAQDNPMTTEIFKAQLHQLTERARAAGLSPIRMLIQAYAKRGEALVNSVLAGLENADEPKKKRKRK